MPTFVSIKGCLIAIAPKPLSVNKSGKAKPKDHVCGLIALPPKLAFTYVGNTSRMGLSRL
ncbi:MAG: hypothetical protein ACK6CP_08865 [Pseudanabaena sp.]|nr:hypothetical protein [Pseudanabaena sp. M090S1SP2A07QC]MCA6517616.1 hypothetical protein [Pseudanabaena sp. M110S1SP2A07QC]MCA6530618.1 hypothetical protein [Pseudanabaena sp. M125S2SP2A07QC]MCA6533543.1 hypothetical protein [Pseudanabaena sp. M176S2SP2A07QC]MCA6539793.1 hypothetical protein [Pseudanabaena sp. M037S2SP2A07QC]MCA6550325.1 hypothetical protein [Pseudanabaena sp. M152S2SP2A07QC]MCA6553093.1 hypothetical protein [Pseudanabaena sp. M135S2SP2A07QC]MCA6556952.1 hypothetical prot